jgi:hypothetical protein
MKSSIAVGEEAGAWISVVVRRCKYLGTSSTTA